MVSGIGRGMFGSPVIVNQYFDKHRSLAAGLSSSGVGIGTFAIVPLTQYLFDYFGFEVILPFYKFKTYSLKRIIFQN